MKKSAKVKMPDRNGVEKLENITATAAVHTITLTSQVGSNEPPRSGYRAETGGGAG